MRYFAPFEQTLRPNLMQSIDRRTAAGENVDTQVAAGFGDEWSRFDQTALSREEKERIFADYFHVFPMEALRPDAVGADFGCGTGRWAAFVAPRVRQFYCVDASGEALNVARRTLADSPNCTFIEASVGNVPMADGTLDFGYSLGVLHHIPDTAAGLASCVAKLKPGAPFLVYLYYRFDNRPLWFRLIWRCSDVIRRAVSRLPNSLRFAASQVLALTVYWPLARAARLVTKLGGDASRLPLSYYGDKPLYVMRNDALDRFGTRLEQRFTRPEIADMMQRAGLERIVFSDRMPFWCAVGYKR
ncbi:MAG TPA: class I SAM-dependent methyltransferase [Steroidobacteraceae bacterium]|jgi:SAM-dependent methyltransferase|nr:class I SAM-dependent methyltransferase [Steroidobacteraceae bacterium]